ncbi:MAG: sugar ABC transporter substrate-binding protein [Synergistaceae bacterium]|jgi:ABC-type sugar transport system substrate-binding protein|nr:sugar ABC transporter substrate-binding protein [Synergistaceae bacterium]
MKRLLALTLALVTVFTLAACSGSSSAAVAATGNNTGSALPYAGKKVGYCPPTLTDSWLALIAEKIGYYCTLDGIEFIATEGQGDITVQIQQTENFIAMGCDVIIAQPVNLDAFRSVVEEARSKGIKVIFWADDPPYEVEGSYMSVDEIQGKLCGEMAIAWANQTFPKDAANGGIKVAWLTTQYDDRPSAKNRQDAMIAAIAGDPRFEVVFRKDNLTLPNECTDAMNECLALNPDINVIFTFSDAHAIGANAGVMADKSLDYSKIAIFGGSSTAEALALVDQSVNNDSVIRGLVLFGQGDDYFIGGANAIKGIIDGTVPLNSAFFCDHTAYNHFGYVSNFNAEEYSKNYVNK